MSKFEKLLKRFLSKPKDFKYGELATLLSGLGYSQVKLRGSRRKFARGNGHTIHCHEPHPKPELPKYVLDLVADELKKEGLV